MADDRRRDVLDVIAETIGVSRSTARTIVRVVDVVMTVVERFMLWRARQRFVSLLRRRHVN